VKRVQTSGRKLADYSDRFRAEKDVRPLIDDILRPLNEGKIDAGSSMTLSQFVESHYEPEYVNTELKPSTRNGYVKLWQMVREISPQLGAIPLRDFTANHAYGLLKKLREKGWGRRSLYHAKTLLSGIFAYAVNTGVLHHNPLREAKMVRTAPPTQTKAASLDEVLAILEALKGKPKARAAIALMYFAGLRPGEARGARWEDYEPIYNYEREQFEWQLIPRHSVWRRHVGTPKTEGSATPVPVIEPLRTILSELREAEGNPQSGWILRGLKNRPLNLDYLAQVNIIPTLTAKGIQWPTYYGLRRGIGNPRCQSSERRQCRQGAAQTLQFEHDHDPLHQKHA
jgi:integrase